MSVIRTHRNLRRNRSRPFDRDSIADLEQALPQFRYEK